LKGGGTVDVQQLGQLLPLLIPIIIIQYGLTIAALLDLVKRERFKLLPKWAWILIVVFVNIVGPILYFVLAREE
jgi:hypothetical protein